MTRGGHTAIREVKTHEGFRACEAIQKQVWRFSDLEVVPSRLMAVISRNGGSVLGAFESGRMIGFAFSYPGWRDGRAVQCSHMLAVLPSHANRGVGYRLKQAQRLRTLARGLDLMFWTFDPLEAKNAYLNLHRLGAVAREFWVNLYGRTSSVLHHGLDTDRLVARWELAGARAERCSRGERSLWTLERVLAEDGCRLLNRVRFREGWPRSSEPDLRARARCVAIEIPFDAGALRLQRTSLARAWQLKLRRTFPAYFRRGYEVADFVAGAAAGVHRAAYLLEKRDAD